MIEKINVFSMLNEYQKHKPMIHAYLRGDSIENYDDENNTALFGMSVGIFLFVFIITTVVWIWALVTLINNWNTLETWAKILGIIGLFLGIGGPIMTLVVSHLGQASGPTSTVIPVGQSYTQPYTQPPVIPMRYTTA